ncbi:MAG: hypothetical protein ACW99U_20565, partial [Candidatus Thorarchaeota archaeon]
EMRDVVCRVTRFTTLFTDGHPSYAQNTHSRVWERVDIPMTISDTLTAHILDSLSEIRAGYWESLDTLLVRNPSWLLGVFGHGIRAGKQCWEIPCI